MVMNLRPNLLPALGVFAAAARYQNFAHAAEELHLTASAVSHHVRRLESALDVVLFHRHARGVSLTGEGRELADAATLAVSELQGVAESLGSQARWPAPAHQHPALPDLQLAAAAPAAISQAASGPAREHRNGYGIDPLRGRRCGSRHSARARTLAGLKAHHLMDDELFPVASPTLPGIGSVLSRARSPSCR